MNAGATPLRPRAARARRAKTAGGATNGLDTPRARLLAAAEDLVCARGSDQLTVMEVTAAADVSRTTFYAIFADSEDCLLALFDEVCERVGARMRTAYRSQSAWLGGVRAALDELLQFLDDRPNLARFLVLGGVAGESPLVARRRRVVGELAAALEADSPNPALAAEAAPFGSHALVSGAAAIVHSRLVEEPIPPLRDLSSALMAMLVLPFVGEGVARGELARSGARPAPKTVARHGEQSAPRRVSERTARVLEVIARSPGISNRALAAEAGSVDKGQISKLLVRLSGLGLIENDGQDAARHGANAWRVTDAGAELLAVLAAGGEDVRGRPRGGTRREP